LQHDIYIPEKYSLQKEKPRRSRVDANQNPTPGKEKKKHNSGRKLGPIFSELKKLQ